LQALGERLDREEAELRRIAKQREREAAVAAAAAAAAAVAAEAAAREAAVKEAEAAAAAAAVACGVCLENSKPADCVRCAAGHIVCSTCFSEQIRCQTAADVRDAFVQAGCNITCAFCKVPWAFRERDFASIVADDAFQVFPLGV